MEWLSAENVVAVGTAMLGIVASGVMVWYERRVPRRKRIGYRVQMDNPIGDDVRSGRANRRLGLFDEAPGMSDATLVLLRIENDGSQSIADNDYTGRELHGLTAVFTDRTIRGVSVTQPVGTDHLMDHFTPAAGLGYDTNTLRIPRVPLNPATTSSCWCCCPAATSAARSGSSAASATARCTPTAAPPRTTRRPCSAAPPG